MPAAKDTPQLPLEEDGDLVEAKVRRGTIVWGEKQHAGPGDTVKLPRDDVVALQARGVLEDPDRAAPPTGAGPTYGPADGEAGPTIKETE